MRKNIMMYKFNEKVSVKALADLPVNLWVGIGWKKSIKTLDDIVLPYCSL